MKKRTKKIIDIKPHIAAEKAAKEAKEAAKKIEAEADAIQKKAEERVKAKLEELTYEQVVGKLAEAYTDEEILINLFAATAHQLLDRVREVEHRTTRKDDIGHLTRSIRTQISNLHRAVAEIEWIPGVESGLPPVIAHAITAGVAYGLLLRKVGWPSGPGKGNSPEWEYIRQAWPVNKPNRKRAIIEGLEAFTKATGKPAKLNQRSAENRFKTQVIDRE